MTDQQTCVWLAIKDKLDELGDVDIRAGLAYLTCDDAMAIAEAAIEAATAPIVGGGPDGPVYGGNGGGKRISLPKFRAGEEIDITGGMYSARMHRDAED